MTIEAVVGEVVKILSAAGVGWPALLVAVVVVAFAIVALRLAPRLPGDSTPVDHRNDATPSTDRPPATWGQNDGPPGGGMEGG